MGKWSMTIEGEGQHHTGDPQHDADAIARDVAGCFGQEGQTVTVARFEHGSSGNYDNLMAPQPPAPTGHVPENGFGSVLEAQQESQPAEPTDLHDAGMGEEVQ